MMRKKQAGFTLMETMVSLVVLLGVSAIVMSGMVQMMYTEGTITNRTEMHTSVRSATELLEQEIGQAGKISLPPPPAGIAWYCRRQAYRQPRLVSHRSEEHTSELQSPYDLVCRLLLEKKK